MLKARYVEIKRFAVHDGPGIRTTLFLKGCPLHCQWCHNPESISGKRELALLETRCTQCGECAKVCSCHSIEQGKHKIDRIKCIGCGKCVDSCLYNALELYGRSLSVEDAFRLLLEDKKYYETSGGGVTISGGEPLLQSEFCGELLGRLKSQNIHTSIDTCGDVAWSSFEKVLPVTDLFLYDLKHAVSEEHKKITGHGNELLLENLYKLDKTGKPIEIRMVMTPGYNMSDDALDRAGEILSKLNNLRGIKLLPYHSFASSKYEAIGKRSTMPSVSTPSEEMLFAAKKRLGGKKGLHII